MGVFRKRSLSQRANLKKTGEFGMQSIDREIIILVIAPWF